MKKDKKLNRIQRKQDLANPLDKIRHVAAVGMNNEVIFNSDKSFSLVLKDDRHNPFAYIEKIDDTATVVSVSGKPFFNKPRRKNLGRYLTNAVSVSDKIIDNSKINLVKFKSHPKMDSDFATMFKDAVVAVNNDKITAYAEQLIKQRDAVAPA